MTHNIVANGSDAARNTPIALRPLSQPHGTISLALLHSKVAFPVRVRFPPAVSVHSKPLTRGTECVLGRINRLRERDQFLDENTTVVIIAKSYIVEPDWRVSEAHLARILILKLNCLCGGA